MKLADKDQIKYCRKGCHGVQGNRSPLPASPRWGEEMNDYVAGDAAYLDLLFTGGADAGTSFDS
jgi:hypothetical protein